ncbi:DoxX family protein [Pseudomonas sp. 09C 129]|uniref:DoxX family protein n=1 Tax=Pseudomonas sp. 09C 129 TaxID=2054915 RepID=UPI0035312F66
MGRVLAASLFFTSGTQMVLNSDATMNYIISHGLPWVELAYCSTVAILLLGSFSLFIGCGTRIAALALGLFVITAAIVFHHEVSILQERQLFFSNLAISGGLFCFITTGAGRLSIDFWISHRLKP